MVPVVDRKKTIVVHVAPHLERVIGVPDGRRPRGAALGVERVNLGRVEGTVVVGVNQLREAPQQPVPVLVGRGVVAAPNVVKGHRHCHNQKQ